MNKVTKSLIISAVALTSVASSLRAAPPTDENKRFLASYDKAHHALAIDDLSNARLAAGELGAPGSDLAKSKTLAEARAAFSKLSTDAEQRAAGQAGYYVMHCPMKRADWVQTNPKVENPYGGKEMISCGEVKQ